MEARFNSEARTTSRLKHPNNIGVHDFGMTKDGELYLVMDLISGVELSDLPMPMPLQRSLTIVSQVAGALQEAHDLGIVHRDMKPANIMIAQVNGADHAYVLDYGIAKVEGEKHTTTGQFVGSIHYAAPEQAQGLNLNGQTDIYALGVLLYELISGEIPFKGTTTEVFMQVMSGQQRPFPEEFNVPEEVSSLVRQMMSLEPNDRPASMSEVRDRILAILHPHASIITQTIPPSQVTKENEKAAKTQKKKTSNTSRSKTLGSAIIVSLLLLFVAGFGMSLLLKNSSEVEVEESSEESIVENNHAENEQVEEEQNENQPLAEPEMIPSGLIPMIDPGVITTIPQVVLQEQSEQSEQNIIEGIQRRLEQENIDIENIEIEEVEEQMENIRGLLNQQNTQERSNRDRHHREREPRDRHHRERDHRERRGRH